MYIESYHKANLSLDLCWIKLHFLKFSLHINEPSTPMDTDQPMAFITQRDRFQSEQQRQNLYFALE